MRLKLTPEMIELGAKVLELFGYTNEPESEIEAVYMAMNTLPSSAPLGTSKGGRFRRFRSTKKNVG